MTENEIKLIRGRVSRATAGPWDETPSGNIYHNPLEAIAFVGGSGSQAVADAAFIAHAREDIPALLDEIDKLAEENSFLRATLLDIEENCKWFRKIIDESDGAETEPPEGVEKDG